MRDQIKPEELIAPYRYELQRVYGNVYEQACIVEYQKGWFYVYRPIKEGKCY